MSLKVCIVADVLGEENNGTSVACMNLVRYLRAQGDEVRILCCDKENKGKENYYVVGTLNDPLWKTLQEINNVRLAKPDPKTVKEAIKGCDVVHIMMPFALGKAAIKYCKKNNIPVTAGFHAQAENVSCQFGMKNCGLVNKLIYKHFYNCLYKYVDIVHYPTDFIRGVFESCVKHKTNGKVISNGVNSIFTKKEVTRPEELSKHFNIVFTGRYSKEKCHPVLIDAVSKSKYKNNIQLIFAGAGPTRKAIEKLSKKRGIIPPVLKFYSREGLAEVLNCADLYIHVSEIEIEAISCLEAISCGLVPLISESPRSATKAFALDKNNLFKVNDSSDLAKKIDFWIENPSLKEEYKEKYTSFASNHEQNMCMKEMREMLLEAAKKNGRA